ncbi:hypothetical protein [Sphingomonas oryzagri]
MPIEALKDSQIKDTIRRYRERNLTTGGPYTLSELLVEQHRRQPSSVIPTVECAKNIISLSKQSPDGLIFYLDIWKAFFPDKAWAAHESRNIVTNALERVGFYCLRHGLPIIVTLVVNKGKGELTDEAKDNIYNAWVERGVSTQLSRDEWIAEQQALSIALTPDALPTD